MNVANKKNFGNKKLPIVYGRNIPSPLIFQNYKKPKIAAKITEKSAVDSDQQTDTNCKTSNTGLIWAINGKNLDINSENNESATKTTSIKTIDSRIVVAVSSGRGQARQEVGIATIDMQKPLLVLSQISDSQDFKSSVTTINIFNPKEILIPSTFTESNIPNILYETIQKHFRSVEITTVQRNLYNSESGLNQLNYICANEYNSVLLVVQHKFYALAAACALLRHLEVTYSIYYSQKSVKIDYQGSEFSTVIDVDTADRLELVSCLAGNVKYSNLLSVLNHCCTPGGTRLLRANILQPPRDLIIIEQRLDCVEEFNKKPKLLSELRNILNQLIDSERLVSFGVISNQQSLKVSEAQLNYILLLKTSLELISPLLKLLENCDCNILQTTCESLNNESYKKIYDMICETVHEDAHTAKGQAGSLQRCFAVKSGLNSLLDLNRTTYTKIVEEMREYTENLSLKYSVPLRLNHNNKRGFHILFNLSRDQEFDETLLSKEFIQIERKANTVSMNTLELINYKQRIQKILGTIENISSVCLYTFCEIIAYLDMLQSLSCVKSLTNSIRPQFSNYLELEDAFHPYLVFLCDEEPTPNSIIATNDYNFTLITGPNMSGKSIFLKLVVLIQIMAQIGCFVFAKKAVIRIVDSIFSRIGFDDNLEFGASSFVLEMKEMQYILNKMTDKSLIIIDELCRSTTVSEGFCLAWAICEKLIRSKSFVFFATHFTNLAELSNQYFNVRIKVNSEKSLNRFNMEVIEEMKNDTVKLKYTHRLQNGVTTIEKYGLKLAAISALPQSIIDNSFEIFNHLAPKSVENNDKEKYDVQMKLIHYKKMCYTAIANINYLIASDQFNHERFESVLKKSQNDEEFKEIFEENLLKDNNNYLTNLDDDLSNEDENLLWASQNCNDFDYNNDETSMDLTNMIRTTPTVFRNNDYMIEELEKRNMCEKQLSPLIEKSKQSFVSDNIMYENDEIPTGIFHKPNTFEYRIRENFCRKKNIVSSTPISHLRTSSVSSTISSGFQKLSPTYKQ